MPQPATAEEPQLKRVMGPGLLLLFVVGETNRGTAERLGLTEQQVANFKFDFLERLRKFLRQQRLNEDVFPELHEGK